MKLAIMQPYFFPYIGYYQLANAVDEFVFLDDVSFIKKGWIHRNRIRIHDEEYLFSIPLIGASQNRLISETRIAKDSQVLGKFLKTLQQSYCDAPFIRQALTLINEALSTSDRISEVAAKSIELVFQYLDLPKTLSKSSSTDQSPALKGAARIISICKEKGATTYFNPPGGKDLYSEKEFLKNHIELRFLKPCLEKIIYSDSKGKQMVGLSMIDILMWNPPEKIRSFLDHCKEERAAE